MHKGERRLPINRSADLQLGVVQRARLRRPGDRRSNTTLSPFNPEQRLLHILRRHGHDGIPQQLRALIRSHHFKPGRATRRSLDPIRLARSAVGCRHCLLPAGGLSADGLRWMRPKNPAYFLPQAVLAMRLRTRLKRALQQEHPRLFVQILRQVWSMAWVADAQAVGRGEPALKYLAAYVYRTAFSAERILSDDGHFITFSYRHRDSGSLRTVRLPAEAFLHRFLQHVLPRGFQRVRSLGWLSAAAEIKWQRILALLDWKQPQLTPPTPSPAPLCPCCHKPMKLVGLLPRPPPR